VYKKYFRQKIAELFLNKLSNYVELRYRKNLKCVNMNVNMSSMKITWFEDEFNLEFNARIGYNIG